MDTNGILGFFGLLAIIVVAVFILMLIVDWLLCIIDGRDGLFLKKKNKTQTTQNTSTQFGRPEIVKEEKIEPTEQTDLVEEEFGIDYDKAETEEDALNDEFSDEAFNFDNDESLKERSELIDSREEEFDDSFDFDETVKDENEVIEKVDVDYDAMIEEINNSVISALPQNENVEENTQNIETETIAEQAEEVNSDEMNNDFVEDSFFDEQVEQQNEVVEETIIDELSNEQEEKNEETVSEIKKSLEDEIARLQQELEAQQKENEILRQKAEQGEQEIAILMQKKAEEDDNGEGRIVVSGSLEDLEERLEILRERLKINEKDLRINKKEFIPLRKVQHTLEKDEQKLRRREVLVARQKVALYGVNNYVDLDEDKAKKLSEELDLLEGLKLSVAHCEEVMEKNKERYPILENTYNILKNSNIQIKQDIEDVERAIDALKAQQVAQENISASDSDNDNF